MAPLRSENNVASHKIPGLVSKQENPSKQGVRAKLEYSTVLFILSSREPKVTQIWAMQTFPLFSPAGENVYPP